jgi:hypothetical protein
VLYQHKQIDTRTKAEKRADKKAGKAKHREWVPKTDKVVYGPSAVMLNFHTCGILLSQTKDIQDSKEKAARVRARAQFKAVDTDGGGTLDHDELLELLSSMGLQHLAKNDIVQGAEVPGSGMAKLFDRAAREQQLVFEVDPETKESVMSEDQFVQWWMGLKKKKSQGCCAGGIAMFCSKHGHAGFRPIGSVRGECVIEALDSEENELKRIMHVQEEEDYLAKHGEVRGHAAPLHDAPHVVKQISDNNGDDFVPDVWFDRDDELCTCTVCGLQPQHDRILGEMPQKFCECAKPDGSTLDDFRRDIAVHANIYPPFSIQELERDLVMAESLKAGDTESPDAAMLREKYLPSEGVSDLVELIKNEEATTKEKQIRAMQRIRVQEVAPLGPSSLNVTFDVLPAGYGPLSRSDKQKRWGKPAGRTMDSVIFTDKELEDRPEAMQEKLRGKLMHRKQVSERDTKAGIKVRNKLQAAFSGSGNPPSVAHHHCSGLALETMINLGDLSNQSRFLRAVFMLAATVLFYPVIQATLPVITCFAYTEYRYWDTKAKCSNGIAICPAWVPQAFASEYAASQNRTELTYVRCCRCCCRCCCRRRCCCCQPTGCLALHAACSLRVEQSSESILARDGDNARTHDNISLLSACKRLLL